MAITLKTNFATGDIINAADFNTNFVNIATFVDALQAGTNFTAGAIETTSLGNGAVTEPKIANNAVTLAKLATAVANALCPAGTITAYGGSAAPSGWLLCDGSNVSRTTYADLFAILGTSYGSGDGTTTFGLPNLKGRVPVGRDSTQTEFDTLGETGGAKTHTLTTSEMPSHNHTTSSRSWTQSSGSATISDTGHAHTGTTDATDVNHKHPTTVKQKSDAAMTHNGSTTFAAGGSNATGEVTIETGNSYQVAALNHTHSFTTAGAFTGVTVSSVTVAGTFTLTVDNTGGGGAHNNLQPYIVVNYIVKA